MKQTYVDEVAQGRIDLVKNIESLCKLEEPEKDENYREPYAIDTKVVKKILLSGGGPSDGIKLYFDVIDEKGHKDLELSHGVYWRSDWGEYKESELSEREAQAVYDFYMGGYCEI